VPADGLPSSPASDELAVRNVIARLALLADDGDLDDYVALYTEDAEWAMPDAPRRGRADIRAGADARRAAGTTGPGSASRHVVTTTAVTVDGDRAVADSVWMFLVDTVRSPAIGGVGTYHDELVRTAAGWQVARRLITVG